MNFDAPKSEAYFLQATYIPRTCDVPAPFPWRISDVSVFVWNFTFVCMAYVYVLRVTYIWRMKGTGDASTAYELQNYIPFLLWRICYVPNAF